jgi:glycolate oxidase FAD binding subunit
MPVETQPMIDEMAARIRAAAATGTPLLVQGGGTKTFYGEPCSGETLNLSALRGVVSYEPTELVVTARAGTPLAELEHVLAQQRQMLAFEPPHFGPAATVGGCIASGLSGPRRAAAGAVRDFVLGLRMLDGQGRDLSFGGQVMKNVAGYDLSRLQVGALGTLGVLLEVSLKTLPIPRTESSLRLEMDAAMAIAQLNLWGGEPLPISASAHVDGMLYLRLSGAEAAVQAARDRIGGETVTGGETFWKHIREQSHAYFTAAGNGAALWRLSVPSTCPPLALGGDLLIEWGGALRWLISDAPADAIRHAAEAAGGHATLFRSPASRLPPAQRAAVFHPLPPAAFELHRRLKARFDPARILNRGRLYPDL